MANFDYGPAPQAVNGYLLALSREIETPAYIGAVSNYVHANLAVKFNEYLDLLAAANPERFHHVYEWPSQYGGRETIGNPAARLWNQSLRGNGRSKLASFTFKASVRPSPVNPILTTPGKNGKSVKTGVHIFVWKAPVMEAGAEITVTAKLAKYLAFVHQDENGGGNSDARVDDKSGIAFAKETTFTAGGGKTTGAFTGAWIAWWTELAGHVYDTDIAPVLQRDLNVERELGTLGSRWGRKVSKTFNIATNTQAYHDGEIAGLVKMRALENKYIEQARARRALIYGE